MPRTSAGDDPPACLEAIVNHPVRRRIVSFLMVFGSPGFVSVLSTIVVSLVDSSGTQGALLRQILWLGAPPARAFAGRNAL